MEALPDISNIIKTGDALEQRTYSYLSKAQSEAKSGVNFSQELAECLSALKDFTDYNKRALDEMESKCFANDDLKFVVQIVNPIREDREKKVERIQDAIKRLQN